MALVGITTSADANLGNGYTLLAIAVVVIGGTSVAGGKANVPGIWAPRSSSSSSCS